MFPQVSTPIPVAWSNGDSHVVQAATYNCISAKWYNSHICYRAHFPHLLPVQLNMRLLQRLRNLQSSSPPVVRYSISLLQFLLLYSTIKLLNLISGLMVKLPKFLYCEMSNSLAGGCVRGGSGVPGCHDNHGSSPSCHGPSPHEGHTLERNCVWSEGRG